MLRKDIVYMTMILLLLCFLSGLYQVAYAAELPEEYLDSGVSPAGWETMAADIAAIRQSLDILLYFVIPFSFALFICWKLGQWFYCTFIRSVL